MIKDFEEDDSNEDGAPRRQYLRLSTYFEGPELHKRRDHELLNSMESFRVSPSVFVHPLPLAEGICPFGADIRGDVP